MALHLRERNEFAVTRWPPWRGPLHGWSLGPRSRRVRRSGKARRGLGAARQTGRPPEAVGNGAKPDRSDAVLALVVGDLARISRKQRRKRGPSSRNGGVLQTTSRGEQMETVELSRQQSARMADLPEDYRVVGAERMAGCGVCSPTAAWHRRRLSRGCDPTWASASSDDDDAG